VADAYRVVDTKNGLFYYILLYLGGLAFSILSDLAKHKNNPYYRAVGASGAVSAVVFASILLNPLAKIYLFFIPIGIPAFIFGIIYLIYSAYMARNSHGHIGHAAHFWGAVYGVIFTVIFEPRLVMGFATKVTDFF
jgi:membrane associated rhomboid family serine protease